MIDFADYEQFSEALGVPLDQVRRDHLISHVLGALSTEGGFVFFGGTALNRTLLTGRRLSEDIDLYATENDADWVGVLNRVSLFVRRGFGATVASRLHRTGDVTTYSIAGGNLAIRLQTVGYRYEYSLLPGRQPAVTRDHVPTLPISLGSIVTTRSDPCSLARRFPATRAVTEGHLRPSRGQLGGLIDGIGVGLKEGLDLSRPQGDFHLAL